jgi:hypothetical protein
MAKDSPTARAGMQPPVPMAQVASAAARGKPATGGGNASAGVPGMPASPRSKGASKGNQARKASFASQGGRPR